MQHDVLNDILTLSKELIYKSSEINKQMIRNNPKENPEYILNSTNDFVVSHIDTFQSRYKRNLHYEKSEFFVAPKVMHLGGTLNQI